MKNTIKIANTQAFWGDRSEASSELLEKQPDLDYLTLDYLSEVSLSIMAVQREKDSQVGYARDFIEVVKSLIPFWKNGSKVKVVTNAGGLNPRNCAEACIAELKKAGLHSLKIAIVHGDDVLEVIKKNPLNPKFNNLESHEPISEVLERLT
ncbi:MAG TPA: acyclic terpene utilization AtuA family protein, partial [Parachlamydiaceae bacterium]|nr:acyclic terpene utilization AtuA family protein [Parachlamydiaceae bacterium]